MPRTNFTRKIRSTTVTASVTSLNGGKPVTETMSFDFPDVNVKTEDVAKKLIRRTGEVDRNSLIHIDQLDYTDRKCDMEIDDYILLSSLAESHPEKYARIIEIARGIMEGKDNE